MSDGPTWLVCGGRDFADLAAFEGIMSDLVELGGRPAVVVHGGASGADAMAGEWARVMGINCVVYHADWKTHGKAAGPMRNQKMLDDMKPDLVVAMPGGRGTADMIRRAKAAGVEMATIAVCGSK